jgi:hypothetical protein
MADLRQGASVPEPGSYDDPNQDTERKRAAEASLRESRLSNTESAILGTQGGREWVWGLLNSFHVFEMRVALSGAPYEQGFMNGEREAGLRLMRKFSHVSPENFGRMFVEQDHD